MVKEIRIGNLLQIPNGQSHSEVTGITNTGKIWFVPNPAHEQCAWMQDEIKRIRLTEEWLTRFGFKENSEPHFHPESKTFENDLGDLIVLEHGEFNYQYPSRYVGEIEVKYVHQLQNLYFALTGNELILKATEK